MRERESVYICVWREEEKIKMRDSKGEVNEERESVCVSMLVREMKEAHTIVVMMKISPPARPL